MNSWLIKPGLEDSETDRRFGKECEIVVAYEDAQTQDQLMRACDLLAKKLWQEREFKFQWWKFSHFSDPHIAKIAATTAHTAELIVFSTEAQDKFPEPVIEWIESWLPQRNKSGTIAALFSQSSSRQPLSTLKHQYLTNLARRMRMDYHSQLLPPQAEAIEASLEIILKRPDALTNIVKEILDHDPCQRLWGIND